MSNVIIHPSKERTFLLYLEGATTIKLYSYIPTDSLKYYRYSIFDGDVVVAGKRDLIPVALKEDIRTDFGTYSIANQNFAIVIYKVGDEENAKRLTVLNKKLKPVEIVSTELSEALIVYKKPKVIKFEINKKGDTTVLETQISNRTSSNINIHGGKLPFNKDIDYAEITIKPIDNDFLYKILIKRQLGDEIFIDMIDNVGWIYNEMGNLSKRLDKEYFEKPGKYTMFIYPKIGNTDFGMTGNAKCIEFEIGAPDYFTAKQLAIYLLIVGSGLGIIAGLVIYYIKRKGKRKLLAEQQQKDIAKTQLASIRSQLNPHFMFNALAGIQSLMNDQKTKEANQYLNKFSRLTRNVLDNKELISLAEEKTLLDDYLQMEQLRFGFRYEINVEPNVDLNIEIPAMLLQPFVENAVKHGIAEKGKQGEVCIRFIKQEKNLILELKDNGKGFDTSKTYEGYGLQLSKNRILLLNGIYKEDTILLTMNSESDGINITITLTNWL
ncbi:sensor histidine kinase [Pedobacter changchengzhani]|nr:histidine kinase [Pedobacter changchengzhani]